MLKAARWHRNEEESYDADQHRGKRRLTEQMRICMRSGHLPFWLVVMYGRFMLRCLSLRILRADDRRDCGALLDERVMFAFDTGRHASAAAIFVCVGRKARGAEGIAKVKIANSPKKSVPVRSTITRHTRQERGQVRAGQKYTSLLVAFVESQGFKLALNGPLRLHR